MTKDDFVDILDVRGGKKSSEDEGTVATIIKDGDLSLSGTESVNGEAEVVESESFVLKIYKKGDVVDKIEIECRCGRTSAIQLHYYNPKEAEKSKSELYDTEVGSVHNEKPTENDMQRPLSTFSKTAHTNSEEDDNEFYEGIPARTISIEPKHTDEDRTE